jgi:hypothetical protein
MVTIQRTFETRCVNTRRTQENWWFCRKLTPQGSAESTRGIVIPPITSSWMMNPPEESLFRWELPAQGH